MNLDQVVSGGIGGIIVAALVGAAVWFLRPYLARKGENLATKQDIEHLTRAQEGVKSEFNLLLEMQRSEAQLRLAVVEGRFQAHQEAHSLWIKLVGNVHSDDIGKVVMECQSWWVENSLYLDPDARKAFRSALFAANNNRDFLVGPRDAEHIKLINDNWREIMEAGAIIEAAVNLPSLAESEIRRPGEAAPSALPPDERRGE